MISESEKEKIEESYKLSEAIMIFIDFYIEEYVKHKDRGEITFNSLIQCIYNMVSIVGDKGDQLALAQQVHKSLTYMIKENIEERGNEKNV
jgi:hypothetical protein